MKIIPFKGILYDTKKVGLKDVITLPYDKISKAKKAEYEQKSPYNMVHLVLPRSNKIASALFHGWLGEGILKQDNEEAFYVYEEEFEYPKGVKKVRRGFVGLLEVKPFARDTIMPHERTFPKVVDDRMDLLDRCRANIEQIFVLFNGKNINDLLKGESVYELKDEFGITHRIAAIKDKAVISAIQGHICKAQLFIADGHHRYTASLMYSEKAKDVPGANYIMVTFVDSDDPGLTILPTHRVLKEVPNFDNGKFLKELEKYFVVEKGRKLESKSQNSFGVVLGDNEYYTIKLKTDVSLEKILNISKPRTWLYLDVNVLHLLIMKHIMVMDTSTMEEEGNIVYVREEDEVLGMIKNKQARIAFILNPTKIQEVKDIVGVGDVMPHKSTDFYPKLHSGFVMRKF